MATQADDGYGAHTGFGWPIGAYVDFGRPSLDNLTAQCDSLVAGE